MPVEIPRQVNLQKDAIGDRKGQSTEIIAPDVKEFSVVGELGTDLGGPCRGAPCNPGPGGPPPKCAPRPPGRIEP